MYFFPSIFMQSAVRASAYGDFISGLWTGRDRRAETGRCIVYHFRRKGDSKGVLICDRREKLTYTDQEHLYIAVGYGVQQTGGYSIAVNQCYLTKNAIYFDTTLVGPSKGEQVNQAKSYPYLVVKTGYSEKSVVFE